MGIKPAPLDGATRAPSDFVKEFSVLYTFPFQLSMAPAVDSTRTLTNWVLQCLTVRYNTSAKYTGRITPKR